MGMPGDPGRLGTAGRPLGRGCASIASAGVRKVPDGVGPDYARAGRFVRPDADGDSDSTREASQGRQKKREKVKPFLKVFPKAPAKAGAFFVRGLIPKGFYQTIFRWLLHFF
jgi:hypothetical protein